MGGLSTKYRRCNCALSIPQIQRCQIFVEAAYVVTRYVPNILIHEGQLLFYHFDTKGSFWNRQQCKWG